MGYSTVNIDGKSALAIIKCEGFKVVSASDVSYFNCPYWQGRIEKAEKYMEKPTIVFTLTNGDFVEVEYN